VEQNLKLRVENMLYTEQRISTGQFADDSCSYYVKTKGEVKMSLMDVFRHKGIEVIELADKGVELRKKWENKFTDEISLSEKKSIYFDQFLWHVFSYEKLSCLKNEEAMKAFNQEPKKCCYVFYQHHDNAFMINNADKIKAEDFENEHDVYVVDKNFHWTFVHTHEYYCGPYFYKASK
jgi:hypothetical protein